MTFDDAIQAITEVFRDVLDDPKLVLRPDATAADVDGWDSLAHIELVVGIEKRCGIKFQLAEVQGLANLGELAKTVVKKTGG